MQALYKLSPAESQTIWLRAAQKAGGAGLVHAAAGAVSLLWSPLPLL